MNIKQFTKDNIIFILLTIASLFIGIYILFKGDTTNGVMIIHFTIIISTIFILSTRNNTNLSITKRLFIVTYIVTVLVVLLLTWDVKMGDPVRLPMIAILYLLYISTNSILLFIREPKLKFKPESKSSTLKQDTMIFDTINQYNAPLEVYEYLGHIAFTKLNSMISTFIAPIKYTEPYYLIISAIEIGEFKFLTIDTSKERDLNLALPYRTKLVMFRVATNSRNPLMTWFTKTGFYLG